MHAIGRLLRRSLRIAAALSLALFIGRGLLHQVLQVAACALPSTLGTAEGPAKTWASLEFRGVGDKGFHVPPTAFDLRTTRYRYRVEGRSLVTPRVHLAVRMRWETQAPADARVDVRYLPWAPHVAVAAPALAPVFWVMLFFVLLPLLWVLLWPARAWDAAAGFLGKLPLLPRQWATTPVADGTPPHGPRQKT